MWLLFHSTLGVELFQSFIMDTGDIEYKRKYPLFSACGLNCGLNPRFYTKGDSKCPGCGGENFSAKHPPCGVLSCSQRNLIEYCYLCNEYPCKKYSK